MSQMKHSNKYISDFRANIEKLLGELTLAQTEGKQVNNVVQALGQAKERLAVTAFSNSIKNNDIRTIVKTMNYETIHNAKSEGWKDEITKPQNPAVFNYHHYVLGT